MFIYGHFRIVLRANHVGSSIMRILLGRWEVIFFGFVWKFSRILKRNVNPY